MLYTAKNDINRRISPVMLGSASCDLWCNDIILRVNDIERGEIEKNEGCRSCTFAVRSVHLLYEVYICCTKCTFVLRTTVGWCLTAGRRTWTGTGSGTPVTPTPTTTAFPTHRYVASPPGGASIIRSRIQRDYRMRSRIRMDFVDIINEATNQSKLIAIGISTCYDYMLTFCYKSN